MFDEETQTLNDIDDNTLKELWLAQHGAGLRGKELADAMKSDVDGWKAPAPIDTRIAPNPDAQERANKLKELLAKAQQDPQQQMLERLKAVSGGATNPEEYANKRFENLYGNSKIGTAARFLADVLRGAKGQSTLRESVYDTTKDEFKTLLNETSQMTTQERANNTMLTQVLGQQTQQDKLEQQRKIEETKLGLKEQGQLAQAQFQRLMSAANATKVAGDVADKSYDNTLAWFKERYGNNIDEKTLTSIYDGFVAAGDSPAAAGLKVQALKAAFRQSAQRPQSMGSTSTTDISTDDKGNTTSLFRRSSINRGQANNPGNDLIQRILSAAPNGSPSPLQTPQARGLQDLLQGRPTAPAAAPAAPAAPTLAPAPQPRSPYAPGPSDGARLFHDPKSAELYRGARQGADQQHALASQLILNGLQPGPDGRPAAANWTGPIWGSDIGTQFRQMFTAVTPQEAQAKFNQVMIPFAAARQAVQGRVAVWDAQAAMKAKPASWQLYRNQVLLAAANAINADFETERMVPGDRSIPKSLTVAQEAKIAGEIIRILDQVGTATHGYDLSKPLSKTQADSLIQSMEIHPIRQILAEPEYKYDPKNIPAGARGVVTLDDIRNKRAK